MSEPKGLADTEHGRLSWDSETGLSVFSLQDDLLLGKSPTQEQSLLRGPSCTCRWAGTLHLSS